MKSFSLKTVLFYLGLWIYSVNFASPYCEDTQPAEYCQRKKHYCQLLKDWAQESCARTCGLCKGGCTNVLDCELYDKEVCLDPDYRWWAEDVCPGYCGQCDSTRKSENCNDTIQNCPDYRERCFDLKYKDWVQENCSRYCEVCVERPCRDEQDRCYNLNDACTRGQYWPERNCREHCNLCIKKDRPEPCTYDDYTRDFPCRDVWFKINRRIGKCLWFSASIATWFEARERCEKFRGSLLNMIDPSLRLQDSEVNETYWISLNDIEKESTFTWATRSGNDSKSEIPKESYLLNPGNYSNWVPGHPPLIDKSKNCVLVNGQAKWMDDDCNSRYFYICEMDSALRHRPNLEVQFSKQPNVLVAGSTFQVSCHSFVGRSGSLRLDFSDTLYALPGASSFISSRIEKTSYRFDHGRCDVFSKLTQTMEATPDMDSGWIRCCASNPHPDYLSTCTEITGIHVVKPPVKSLVSVTVHEPPSLVYTHHPIQGRCASGWVDQAASIILRVSNPHTPLGYIITEGSAVPIGNTSSDLMPVDVQTVRGEKGVLYRVYFRLCPRMSMQGDTVTCSVLNADGMPVESSSSDQLVASGVPRRPHLKVFYHRQPNIVGIGRMLTARCVASVGTDGVLVWRLHTKPDTLTWKVRFSDDDGDVHTDSVTITSDKERDPEDGPVIHSRLSVRVTQSFEDARLQCLSYDRDRSNQQTVQYDLDVRAGATSQVLQARDLPTPPMLQVTSHKLYGNDSVLWILGGLCSAEVADNGTLSALIKTDHWAVLWTLFPNGSTEFGRFEKTENSAPDPFVESNFQEEDSPLPGEHNLSARFRVGLREEVNYAIVACFNEDQKNCTRLELDQQPPLRERSSGGESPMSMALPIEAVVITVLVAMALLLVYIFVESYRSPGKLQQPAED